MSRPATLPSGYNTDKCNEDTRTRGVTVMDISGDATQQEMEAWCAQIRAQSGHDVDWFTFVGRDIIKTTGDTQQVQRAILDLYPQLYNQVRSRNPDADTRFLLHYNMRV